LNFSRLVSLAQTASALNVHVLIVEFPMNPLYGQAAFYSEYGPSQQTAHEIFNQFKELEANYPSSIFTTPIITETIPMETMTPITRPICADTEPGG